MKLIKKTSQLTNWRKKVRQEESTVGFVPTMGYLHQGHLSLINRSRKECARVVVSIFVNPLQFGKDEDLDSYPRNLNRDLLFCQKEKVDVVFSPSVREMYSTSFFTYVQVDGPLPSVLEGNCRPGHFRGVTTVLIKLFNIIDPHFSYFGQKDYQQAIIVQKVVRDLNLNTKIIVLPTIRERDGLAVSSRNTYLDKRQRKTAPILYQSLRKGENLIHSGEQKSAVIHREMNQVINRESLAEVEYLKVVDPTSLEEVDNVQGEVLLVGAIKIGPVRLIDNIKVIFDNLFSGSQKT